jgi:hypothetical protein
MRADLYPRAKAEDRTSSDGIIFGSKRELERYYDLKLLEKAGEITALKTHTKFVFMVGPNEVVVGTYTPDFTYIECASGKVIIEDVKSWKRTPKTKKLVPRVNREYGIKKKLMKALFDLDVRET